MLEAWTLSRAASLTLRCSVLCHIQQMHAAMIQHSASGDESESGEVSDPAFSMPAAAIQATHSRGWDWRLPPVRARSAGTGTAVPASWPGLGWDWGLQSQP